ncbi:MAG: DUF2269 family protein [Methylococcales bacterium]|mgnify:CR=1 FL=1|jgi:uncharacterized membrane protein|nr:DUF2269 family protein [Methylococcales bacterium]MBT7443934.1 DUF2269 family protein [Methylococcales bacterium]
MEYLSLKMLHIFGAMIFIGNMTVTLCWKVLSDKTRDAKIVGFSQKVVNITDFLFSSVGIFIILVTGLMMADQLPQVEGQELNWVNWGVRLLITSVALWIVILLPIQAKQAMMVRDFSTEGIPELYWKLGRTWLVFAVIAIALPLANLYFMVYKPM